MRSCERLQRISLGRRTGSRRFVSENADHYPVTRLCFLVDVRRSTYYQWRHRPLSKRDLDDAKLAHEIVEIHQASHGTYGAP